MLLPEITRQDNVEQPLKWVHIQVERPLHQTQSITMLDGHTRPCTAAYNYSSEVQNDKTAGDDTKESCNAKKMDENIPVSPHRVSWLSICTVCSSFNSSKPLTTCQKETEINGIVLQHKISNKPSKGYTTC